MFKKMLKNGIKGKVMRLLGGIFNIFIFYYFLTLCGSAEGSVSNETEGAESQPVPTVQQEAEPCRPPFVMEHAPGVDYLALGYNLEVESGLKN